MACPTLPQRLRKFTTAGALGFLCPLLLCLSGCGSQHDRELQTDVTTTNKKIVHEAWYALVIKGNQVGYSHTKTTQGNENGQTVYCTEEVTCFEVNKGKDRPKIAYRVSTTSTPQGKLLHFHRESSLGTSPMISDGKVVGDQLVIEQRGAETTMRRTVELPADLVVADTCRQSLMNKPIEIDEKRRFRTFDPESGGSLIQEFIAVGYEQTELLGSPQRLLRLDQTITTHAGQELRGSLWVDPQGRSLKMKIGGVESYQTEEQVATATDTGGQFNLLTSTTIALARPLTQGVKTHHARYRVCFKETDPSTVFAQGATQAVRRVDDRHAEIVIRAIGPKTPLGRRFAVRERPTDDDRNPNIMIQSDDTQVVALAEEVAQQERDRWTLAKALELHVHQSMHEVHFKQAFATAAEVARTRTGDCSEHAVLLAAVCRARGIAARVVTGLVYVPNLQAFGYHMWTEVWINDRWIPLDATLGLGGIGAGHLKVASTSLAGGLSDGAFLKIAQLLAAEATIELIDAR